MKPSVLVEPSLVGREHELEQLESFLNEAAEGNGKTVFVSGEAGSGKSRLAREFLSIAREKGAVILSGWCLSDAAIPYFPFIEAFDAYFTEGRGVSSWLSGLRSLEKTERVEPLSPQVWKDQAFDRVAKTLLTISVDQPLVLFIEDIQWADSASLALLHYISRVVNNSERVLVLATFRSEEVTADGEGRPHRLEDEMRAMSREDLFSEISLSNLNKADFLKIAQNMMGGSVQRELVERLARQGNGNALFLVESLRMLVEQKGLSQENDDWRLTVDDFGIPSKIKDIILRRLTVLKYSQRRVLDAASVIGEKFCVELLASVLGQDSLDVLETLSLVAQSTAIVTDQGDFYKFDHARSREVLYEALPFSLKKGYHTRVAERIEEGGRSEKLPFADLAYHYTQAGNEEKALKYSLEAGKEALAIFSNEEAIKNFKYVLEKVADKQERLPERLVAMEGLGDALYSGNYFKKSREILEQLALIQKGSDKLRALRKAIVAAFYEGNIPKIKELTLVAEENALADRVENARILSHKARARGLEGDYVYCKKVLGDAILVYEEEYCLGDVAWDLFVMSNLLAWSGELEEGVALALRSISMHAELGDIHAQLEAHLFAGHAFAASALNEEAVQFYSRVIEIDNKFKTNDYVRLIGAHLNLGMLKYRTKPEEAKALGLKALDYCNMHDTIKSRSIGSVFEYLALLLFREGNITGGDAYYFKLMGLPENERITPRSVIWINAVAATYYACKNRFDESHKFIEKQLDFERKYYPAIGMQASFMNWHAWILEKEGRNEESKRKLEEIQRLVVEARERFAHVNIFTGLVTFTHPGPNQVFEIRFDVVNSSRSQGTVLKVENLLIPELKIVEASPNCIVKSDCIEFKDKAIKPFEVKTIKLKVIAPKPATHNLAPTVTWTDDLEQIKITCTRQFTLTIKPLPKQAQTPGRISTGFSGLDRLLLGGIPEGYAVALSSSSSNERDNLIERFVRVGGEEGAITFYLVENPRKATILAEEFPSVNAFVCNPKADLSVGDLPNIFKLKGVDNLTDIDIALTKASRQLNTSQQIPKRACIEIISDVLLQHNLVTTKKWLSGLLQDLKSKGFTTLAVVDPKMHQPEETQVIRSLFDGEIEISDEDSDKILRITKLFKQDYLQEELVLTKEGAKNN